MGHCFQMSKTRDDAVTYIELYKNFSIPDMDYKGHLSHNVVRCAADLSPPVGSGIEYCIT